MSHSSSSSDLPAESIRHADDVFENSFSEEERLELLKEDREAQMGISAILSALIASGMILGILSVLLIIYFGF